MGGGSFSRIDAITLIWLFPSKARFPVAISYSTAPRAKMSDRTSASFPSICSGDMYWKVPTSVPSAVNGVVWVGMAVSDEPLWGATPGLASPKSISFAPDCVSMTLPGLRSRWTRPRRCAPSSASAIWMPIFWTCSAGRAPRLMRSASVSPSSSSITRKSTPSSCPKSYRAQMCGWLRLEMVFASRSKRCLKSGFAAKSAGRTLIATSRSSRVSFALYTSPIPPAPSGATIS